MQVDTPQIRVKQVGGMTHATTYTYVSNRSHVGRYCLREFCVLAVMPLPSMFRVCRCSSVPMVAGSEPLQQQKNSHITIGCLACENNITNHGILHLCCLKYKNCQPACLGSLLADLRPSRDSGHTVQCHKLDAMQNAHKVRKL